MKLFPYRFLSYSFFVGVSPGSASQTVYKAPLELPAAGGQLQAVRYANIFFSNSSSDLPLVSGTAASTKTNPKAQITAYSQKAPAVPTTAFKEGNVWVKTKSAIHKVETAMERAVPRMRLGKISEMRTQVIGASVMA